MVITIYFWNTSNVSVEQWIYGYWKNGDRLLRNVQNLPAAAWTGIPDYNYYHLRCFYHHKLSGTCYVTTVNITTNSLAAIIAYTSIHGRSNLAPILADSDRSQGPRSYRSSRSDLTGISREAMGNASPSSRETDNFYDLPSYMQLTAYSSAMMAHVVLMIVAWVFTLPVGMCCPLAGVPDADNNDFT